MRWDLHEKVEETKEWLKMEEENILREDNYTWGFVLKETNELIGSGGIFFNGLKQNKDFAFVLARGENGPELVKVNKKDGKEEQKISLDSNKPMYEIDPVNGNVYYVTENEVRIYK